MNLELVQSQARWFQRRTQAGIKCWSCEKGNHPGQNFGPEECQKYGQWIQCSPHQVGPNLTPGKTFPLNVTPSFTYLAVKQTRQIKVWLFEYCGVSRCVRPRFDLSSRIWKETLNRFVNGVDVNNGMLAFHRSATIRNIATKRILNILNSVRRAAKEPGITLNLSQLGRTQNWISSQTIN